VSVPDEHGGRQEVRARVIDWRDAAANDWVAAQQLTVTGPLYTCRPDIVGFVNGLPWVLIECKAPGVPARRGFDDNLTSYKHAQNGDPLNLLHIAQFQHALPVGEQGSEAHGKPGIVGSHVLAGMAHAQAQAQGILAAGDPERLARMPQRVDLASLPLAVGQGDVQRGEMGAEGLSVVPVHALPPFLLTDDERSVTGILLPLSEQGHEFCRQGHRPRLVPLYAIPGRVFRG